MFVELGNQIRVEDLIRGMIIQSGNDACIVLAEGVAGSEEQFVDMMNAEAKRLGLTNSHFMNCTGWPDPQHYMSCRDIATLARRIIQDFPEYYHYDSEKTFTYHGIVQYNRNPLVQRGLADGLKTGHTEAGGYGVVASTEHNGRRVILVLNGMPTSTARVQESQRLMSWAFANFEDVTLFSANDVVENAPVWLGTRRSVPLVGGKDLVLTMPRSWRQHARVTISYDSPIPAPIHSGDVVGKLTVSGQGVPQAEVPLLAAEDVPRLSLPGRAVAILSHYVTGS
jgi:D-alanyl-D-alanine carboxypeptidase (penicillin-binding protein 5/6)